MTKTKSSKKGGRFWRLVYRFRLFIILIFLIFFALISYSLLKPSRAINADIDGSGRVDSADLAILVSNFGRQGMTFSQGDISGDGKVDGFDGSALLTNWGSGGVPTVNLTASPNPISSGQSSTLSWSSTNASSCTASGGWSGTKATSGTASTGALSSNTTFTLACTGSSGSATGNVTVTIATAGAAPTISIQGNHIVTSTGQTVVLRGVNRSGAEYMSTDSANSVDIWDGPTNDDTSVNNMKAWGVNTVRIPLNEDAWLGINGVSPTVNGAPYRNEIVSYVNRLNRLGIIAIINLHFSSPGTTVPHDQVIMADADHAPAFWTSVANTFKDNHSVIFDLFNEPYPNNNSESEAAWKCNLDGVTSCSGFTYTAVGMQQMLDAVRATGATQPVMIAGPAYAGTFGVGICSASTSCFNKYLPNDPQHQLMGSIHIYGLPLDSPDRVASMWDSDVLPIANQFPVVIGEFGDTDCTARFSPPLMTWADAHGVGYTAWAWNTSSCANDPSLITNYNGTPTAYGIGVRDHMKVLPAQW